ncbi:MAG: type II toxin-antitoxin system RelE/ParE family toxin [Chloroflexota bacterium]|nr:type II toxin-antitoxin system RelE/ParE family toxin [Chloroflexota bacterium]
MIRSFRHRGLRRLYERGDSSRVPADQVQRIGVVFSHLDAARVPSDLALPGYRLHPLKGDLRHFWSISVSGNWRVIFRIEDGNVYDVDLVDYH